MKNYGAPEVSKQAVANDPDRFLKAITAMFRRAAGYDLEGQDWFWVKNTPDGSVLSNPNGMKLGGGGQRDEPGLHRLPQGRPGGRHNSTATTDSPPTEARIPRAGERLQDAHLRMPGGPGVV
jgi:hypothetical protein